MEDVHKLWVAHGMDLGLEHMSSIANHLCPDAYLVGIVDGRIVACSGYANLTDDICMHGGLVVDPSAEGMGIGKKLFFATFPSHLPRNIVADAVPVMVPTYKTYGYLYKDFINVSYSGQISSNALGGVAEGPQLDSDFTVVDQMDIDFRSILEFDRTMHPEAIRRDSYMKWYFDKEDTKGYVILDKEKNVIALGGRTVIGGGHHFVGPIYAGDDDHAEVLFRKLVSEIPNGTPAHMMAPQDNLRAGEIITKAGLSEDAQAVRIYSKGVQTWPQHRNYGNTLAGYAGFMPN